MIIKKILNNNVVLSEKNRKEIIITGKGIAFGKKTSDTVDKNKIEKTFILEYNEASEKFKSLLEHIPMKYISVSYDIIEYAENMLNTRFNDFIYVTLTDHLNFAIQRNKENISYVNALLWEIKKFYSKEYEVGLKAIELIKEELGVSFPEDEAANIALHLVNAKINSKSEIGETVQITKMTQDILNIIKYTFNIELDETTLSYERFITHLKFFFQRIMKNNQVNTEDDFIYDEVRKKYRKSYECALKIESYLTGIYERELTKEEKAYLAIHIRRITEEQRKK
ncbi:MAG: PRD domain-containing protein [Leptotrichiaceae bacterium]|nr:PRD domain-containing protein [Leptotrichiaceae bacterium]